MTKIGANIRDPRAATMMAIVAEKHMRTPSRKHIILGSVWQIGQNLTKSRLKMLKKKKKAPPGETVSAAEDTEGHHQERMKLG